VRACLYCARESAVCFSQRVCVFGCVCVRDRERDCVCVKVSVCMCGDRLHAALQKSLSCLVTLLLPPSPPTRVHSHNTPFFIPQLELKTFLFFLLQHFDHSTTTMHRVELLFSLRRLKIGKESERTFGKAPLLCCSFGITAPNCGRALEADSPASAREPRV